MTLSCRNYSAHPFAYLNRSTHHPQPLLRCPKSQSGQACTTTYHQACLRHRRNCSTVRTCREAVPHKIANNMRLPAFSLLLHTHNTVLAFKLRQTHPRSTPDRLPERACVFFSSTSKYELSSDGISCSKASTPLKHWRESRSSTSGKATCTSRRHFRSRREMPFPPPTKFSFLGHETTKNELMILLDNAGGVLLFFPFFPSAMGTHAFWECAYTASGSEVFVFFFGLDFLCCRITTNKKAFGHQKSLILRSCGVTSIHIRRANFDGRSREILDCYC